MSKPATGVTDAAALSLISLSPATLTFTGPNQQLTTTVAMNVPLGNFAGNYAYHIVPTGWPVTTDGIIDNGATVNARVSPPNSTDRSPPAIALLSPATGTVYTYFPVTGVPVTVPVSFAASVGTNGQPIDGMRASINSSPIILSTTGVLTSSASATGSVQLTTPGNYTISVLASNTNGTSTATSDISVVISAPPPTVTAVKPANNATYSFTAGGSVVVPVSFNAVSQYGNVTALSATLNGSPLPVTLTGVGSATTATGTASLTVASAGTYSLVFSAANAYGSAAPVTVNFTVTSVIPVPTVSILTPANGTVFTRVAGSAATVVNYSFSGGTTYNKVTSVNVTLDGVPVPATIAGLNTASITGAGSASYTSGGTHTLTVTLSNGGASASASTSFTVKETQPSVCRDLIWLPPISLNKTIAGGSTMPIKFTLNCGCDFVRDTNVVIAIYELFSDGTTSHAVLYPYDPSGNPNPPDYAIDGNHYQLNFATATGNHSYQIDVYTTASGSVVMLGSKVLNTAKDLKHDCTDHRHVRYADHDHNKDCDRDDRFDDDDNRYADHDRSRDCDHDDRSDDDDNSNGHS